MTIEKRPRHPRDTRPFGTADHRVDEAYGDQQLADLLDYLADEQWIPGAPLFIEYVNQEPDGIVCLYKVVSWRSHTLKDGPTVEETPAAPDRRVNRSRHQEAAADLLSDLHAEKDDA